MLEACNRADIDFKSVASKAKVASRVDRWRVFDVGDDVCCRNGADAGDGFASLSRRSLVIDVILSATTAVAAAEIAPSHVTGHLEFCRVIGRSVLEKLNLFINEDF